MFRKTLLVIFGAALCISSLTASAEDKLYKLAFDISHMGQAIGSPTIVVREGVPASMEISGAEGYKMTLTATDAGDGKIKVATTFSSTQGNSSPIVIVKEGKPASVSDGRFEFKLLASRQSS